MQSFAEDCIHSEHDSILAVMELLTILSHAINNFTCSPKGIRISRKNHKLFQGHHLWGDLIV